MKKSLLLSALVVVSSAIVGPTLATAAISGIYSGGAVGGPYTETGEVTSILNVAASTETFVLTDSTGSVLYYAIPKTYYTPVAGDNVTISGATDAPYQDAPEMTSTGLSAANFTLNSAGNAIPTPPVLTTAQFLAAGTGSATETAVPPYAEAIVTLDNVFLPPGTTSLSMTTNTAYTINDLQGNNVTMYDYKSDSAVLAAVTASNAANTASSGSLYSGPLDITGYVDVYYGVPEIYPTSITAGTVVPEPASLGLIGIASLGLLKRRRRA